MLDHLSHLPLIDITTNLTRIEKQLSLFFDGEDGASNVPVRYLHFGAVDAYVPSVAFIALWRVKSCHTSVS